MEEGKAKLEAKDNTGGTPLYVAAATGQQAVALHLLSQGADVEVCSLLLMHYCQHSSDQGSEQGLRAHRCLTHP